MLGKLMKYELRATARVFLPLYGALIVVSVFNRNFMRFAYRWPYFICTAVSVIMIVAICVITLTLTLQRFNKNLLNNEGYLMFTLPVSTDSLIISKMLISSLWFVVSSIVVCIAVMIMTTAQFSLRDFLEAVAELLNRINLDQNICLYFAEMLFIFILSLFSSILMIYACLALGLLSNKHRGLTAFGAFIGFNIVGQCIAAVFFASVNVKSFVEFFDALSYTAQIQAAFLTFIILNIITGAVFYFITRYMLVNKLNLE